MDLNKDRKLFSIRFGFTGIALTVCALTVISLLFRHEGFSQLLVVSFLMFGVPFLLSSMIAILTKRPDLKSLKGMAVGFLVISILIVLYSTILVLTHTGGGANIGGLAPLLLSPFLYCVGGYLGYKSGGLF